MADVTDDGRKPEADVTPMQILILVGSILLIDAMVVSALMAAGGAQWKRFAACFPQRPVLESAQQRTWQTIRLGIFNWGLSFTISVDAAHVHLTPGPRIGKLMGIGTASIPVEAFAQLADVASTRASRRGRMKLKLAGQNVELPNWIQAAIAEAQAQPVMPRPLPPVR